MQGKWCKPSSQTVQKLNTLALFPWLKLLLPDTGYCESNINNVALRILDVPYGQYLDQKLWRLLLILAFRWTIHHISFGDNIGKKRSGNYNVMCCTVVGYYPDSLCGHSMCMVSVSRQPSFSRQPCWCYLCSRLCGGNTAFVRKVTSSSSKLPFSYYSCLHWAQFCQALVPKYPHLKINIYLLNNWSWEWMGLVWVNRQVGPCLVVCLALCAMLIVGMTRSGNVLVPLPYPVPYRKT